MNAGIFRHPLQLIGVTFPGHRVDVAVGILCRGKSATLGCCVPQGVLGGVLVSPNLGQTPRVYGNVFE